MVPMLPQTSQDQAATVHLIARPKVSPSGRSERPRLNRRLDLETTMRRPNSSLPEKLLCACHMLSGKTSGRQRQARQMCPDLALLTPMTQLGKKVDSTSRKKRGSRSKKSRHQGPALMKSTIDSRISRGGYSRRPP